MKIRIKSGDCPSYLTVGKVYEAKRLSFSDKLWSLVDDQDDEIIINLTEDCPHLNGGSWEIVND